jgi:anti-sigma regulatory factor (Ser/Thr protein kinase)
MTSFTADDASVIAQRIAAERIALSAQWLARLREILTVTPNDVFPSEQLLDHIPVIVDQIAGYLSAPADEEIAANAAVMDKARELGLFAARAARDRAPAPSGVRAARSDSRGVPRGGDRSARPAAVGRGMLQRAAPVDARGARADAHHGRHVHQRVLGQLVLLNLVVNAVKYSDAAKPEPFVEIVRARRAIDGSGAADGAACTICVRDNGLGIPDVDQPAIFERFFRAHAHMDQELGVTGTGLGLAIVIDCVDALGGTIR